MKTKNLLTILALVTAVPAARAQTNNINRPATVSDQISITSDYVGSIAKNVEALGAQGGGSSNDYQVASGELRDRVASALRKFESSIKNMVLLPLGRTIDAYNTTLTQPNLNAEVKKIQLDSKMQVLVSAAATYEASYHQFLSELYQINPALAVVGAELIENRKKHGRAIRLTFADGTRSETRYFDGNYGEFDPTSWAANQLAHPSFAVKFRGASGETGPFFQHTISGGDQWHRISAKDVDAHVNGRGNPWNNYEGAMQLGTLFYPDYAYQYLFDTCKRAARGRQPSQTCMTLLRADLQEYYLNVANILDRDMTIMLADGKTIVLKSTKLDPKAGLLKLIVPSLGGIAYPDNFSSFPATN